MNVVNLAKRAQAASGCSQATGVAGMASSSAGAQVALCAVLEVVLQVVVLVVMVQRRRVLLLGTADSPGWLVWRSRVCFETCLAGASSHQLNGDEVVEGLPPDVVDAISAQLQKTFVSSQGLRART